MVLGTGCRRAERGLQGRAACKRYSSNNRQGGIVLPWKLGRARLSFSFVDCVHITVWRRPFSVLTCSFFALRKYVELSKDELMSATQQATLVKDMGQTRGTDWGGQTTRTCHRSCGYEERGRATPAKTLLPPFVIQVSLHLEMVH